MDTSLQAPDSVLEFVSSLAVSLYDWQKWILLTIDECATLVRKKIAVRAPNGVGKSERIVALSALRWLQRFPRGRVVITSYDGRQLADQVWRALRVQAARFPAWKFRDHEQTIDTAQGGRLRCFTTDDPGRAEGFHADTDCPLLIIVDEAKSVDPEIIKAIDRCSYNVLLYISSPGWKQGPFYDSFTVHADSFIPFHAGLADCPHITKEKIEDIKRDYADDPSFIASVLHGEFMEYEEGVRHILELTDIEAWRSKVVPFKPGPVRIGCDFAAGGDSNVILAGIGNYLKEIVPWKDRNTATATGRFTDELKRIIKRERANRPNIGVGIYGDATGIGRTMVDTIRENGISIVAFNFGAKIKNPVYKDLGTFAWYTAAKRIKDGEIRVANWNHPTVKALIAQLSSRRQKRHSSGCLWMEQKHEMAARGVRSPDIADAFVQVFGIQSPRSFPWGPNDDDSEWTEIAKKHGWEYTSGERAAYFNPLAPENREPSSIGYGDDGHLVHDCWSRGA